MKFITILDPAIDSEEENYDVFTKGQQDDIWIKWPARRNIQLTKLATGICLVLSGLMVS